MYEVPAAVSEGEEQAAGKIITARIIGARRIPSTEKIHSRIINPTLC